MCVYDSAMASVEGEYVDGQSSVLQLLYDQRAVASDMTTPPLLSSLPVHSEPASLTTLFWDLLGYLAADRRSNYASIAVSVVCILVVLRNFMGKRKRTNAWW